MSRSILVSDAQASALTLLATAEKRPVDKLVQDAIDDFLAKKRQATPPDFEGGFGLWGDGEDGLVYQERLRAEW